MLKNRLKEMRKMKRITQQELASIIGITQNAYSYWEQGKVKIDNTSLAKLAEFYGISVDFLLGRKFQLKRPMSEWHQSQIEDFQNAHEYEKDFLLYRYGQGYFDTNNEKELTAALDDELEEDVIIFHRDGKTQRRKFTKEQMAMFMAMVDAIPESDKDI